MAAGQEARATARRIVEQVLAEHQAREAGPPAPPTAATSPALVGSIEHGEVVSAAASEPTRAEPGSSAQQAARRIVDEVLATHEARRRPDAAVATLPSPPAPPTATPASGPPDPPRHEGTRHEGTRHDPPPPEPPLDDDHPLARARRIVEQVLADDAARREAAAGLPDADQTDALTISIGPPPVPTGARASVASPEMDESAEERRHDAEATVPMPVPEPGPTPQPPSPIPDPLPQPLPDPDPEPPSPIPDPLPQPLPDPDPQPPQPEPEPEPAPMQAPRPAAGSTVTPELDAGPTVTPERQVAEETARRIVQEVVAAHEASARAQAEERLDGAVSEAATTQPLSRVEDPPGASASSETAETPGTSPVSGVAGPPPIPEVIRRGTTTGELDTLPPPDATSGPTFPTGRQADPAATTTLLERPDVEPGPRTPRTGRWLLTTIVGAVALALLFPLAVQALRTLITLG